jgi:hypothetical protein
LKSAAPVRRTWRSVFVTMDRTPMIKNRTNHPIRICAPATTAIANAEKAAVMTPGRPAGSAGSAAKIIRLLAPEIAAINA